MNSEINIYKREFMQEVPKKSFVGSEAEYQRRMEKYISVRSSQLEFTGGTLVDFVLAGGILSSR
jgi:hypothetical protein